MEMEASLIMGGSSSSSYLKLVSCKHNDMGFLVFSISPLVHHFDRRRNYNSKDDVGFKLSISSVSTSTHRTSVCLRPVSCSSSYTDQAELENHKLLIEESLNGHTIETETVRVKFQLHKECLFGQNFLITGDDRVLGLWDPNNAVPLTWSEGHLWSADLDIPIGKCIKFKFIMQESNGVIVWQPGPDRVLECFKTDKMMTLCEDWEDPDLRKIIEIELALNREIQMVEASGETLIEPLVSVNGTEEPNVYATNMKQVLVSDEGVPVLVPGLNQYQEDSVNEASNDEPESLNGSAMVSTEPDMAKDLILPELDLKGDAHTSNLNPRTEISSVREIQDSSDQNEHQEIQQVTETQPREHSLHNDVNWGHNAVQKLQHFWHSIGLQLLCVGICISKVGSR